MRLVGILVCVLSMAACTAPDDAAQDTATAPVAAASARPAGAATAGETAAEAAARDVVVRFGAELKNVSTLAPADSVRDQLREHYADLVTPGLLQAWLADPSQAPGHDVSSPWPDAINVRQVDCASAAVCEVQGVVRYATSIEVAKGGVADQKVVNLTVKRGTDGWRIDAVHL
jgi:hypothetical protein